MPGMDAGASTDLTGRARLRRAALELFAEQGFKATSTRAVAARAGLSPALVIRHFGSKQGLRAAVDRDVLARIADTLRRIDAEPGDLMASLGQVSARLFGADPVLRGYLRHALLEDSEASAALYGRLLSGARAELDRLAPEHGENAGGARGPDQEWAPFQMLCLILGPLLLERVMQPHLEQPMFAPDVLARRSAANQRLLSQGFWGQPQEPSGG
jgi:AcrR family transcriptional regulator